MSIVETEFKIDEMPLVSMSTEERENIELLTDNVSVLDDDVFRISLKDQSTYTNLSDAYLQINFKITKEDNTAYAVEDKVALRNSVASLFSRAVLRVNNQIVETCLDVSDSFLMKSLLHYSDDYSRTTATNHLFYKDTGNKGNNDDIVKYTHSAQADPNVAVAINSLNINENPLWNFGYEKRQARCSANKVVSCLLPLNQIFGFCSVDRVIVNQEVAIELTKSQKSHHLYIGKRSDNNAQSVAGKVRIERLSMWLPRIRPKPELDLAIKSSMSNGLVSNYLFNTWNAYTSPVLTAGQNTYRVLTTAEDVLYAFVVMREFQGQGITDNKVVSFKNNILTCEARLNGRVYPTRRYESVNAELGSSRAYNDLISYMNRSNDLSSGIQLSLDEYRDNQVIIPFDFTSKPFNWGKSPLTLEILVEAVANPDQHKITVVVVSRKGVQINYQGSQATIVVA